MPYETPVKARGRSGVVPVLFSMAFRPSCLRGQGSEPPWSPEGEPAVFDKRSSLVAEFVHCDSVWSALTLSLTPIPIVEERAMERTYVPLAADGFAFMIAS